MALLGTRRVGAGHSSAASAVNTQKTNNKSNSSVSYQKYLTNCKSLYSCIYCRTHLANHDELISRSFQGNRSRAYLFNSLINITTGPSVQRELNTGAHAVADIFCSTCHTTIGWKYEKAYVESQKYKEGKYIIELAHVVRENRHLELDKRDELVMEFVKQQQQHHQQQERFNTGSLSPPTTSISRSSLASHSPNCDTTTHHHLHYACLHHELEQRPMVNSSADTGSGDENGDDDDEEEEVLMFPFHDDLYGERASYSNLSHSRLSSYKRRRAAAAANRRSLHLDFDWQIGGGGGSSFGSSETSAKSPVSSPDDNDDDDNDDEPKLSTFSSATTSSTASSSSASDADCQQASTSKDIKHFNSNNNNNNNTKQECDQEGEGENSMSMLNSGEDKQETHSTSLQTDDEETFYDCCTDHNISSSSSSSSASASASTANK